MRRIYLHAWLTTMVLLPSLGHAQQPNVLSQDLGAGDTVELGQGISARSQRSLESNELTLAAARLPGPAFDAEEQAPFAATGRFGGYPDSRWSAGSTTASHSWYTAAIHPRESSHADTNAHPSSRTMHIVVGAVAGVLGGVLLGKSVDKGTAGCGQEQSGAFCDWGSGLYEPVFGAIGAVVGGVVGALLPHD